MQVAAKRYDRAISSHQAAQQMVSVAETGFKNSFKSSTLQKDSDEEKKSADEDQKSEEDDAGGSFDLAWQEMLNVAVSKVYEAERELTDSERQHESKMKVCVNMETQVKAIEKELKGAIKKAK